MTTADVDRFWSKVQKTPTCWVWTGGCWKKGYGFFCLRGRMVRASHVAWFLATGEWPKEMVLHECDNPPCVRFDHLFEGNHATNMADMVAKGRADDRRGEAHHLHKLENEDVLAIRSMRGTPQQQIADLFGVSVPTVSMIQSGKRWGHI